MQMLIDSDEYVHIHLCNTPYMDMLLSKRGAWTTVCIEIQTSVSGRTSDHTEMRHAAL